MKTPTLVLALAMLFFFACTRTIKEIQKPKTMTQEEKIEQLAQQTYQKNYSITYNKNKTVVCIAKSIKKRPNAIYYTLAFILYELNTEEILFKERIPKATGEWISNKEYKVTTIPGIMREDAKTTKKNGFIYQVDTKTKRKL